MAKLFSNISYAIVTSARSMWYLCKEDQFVSAVPGDSGWISGLCGGDRHGSVPKRYHLAGSCIPVVCKQPSHRVSGIVRPRIDNRRRDCFLPSLSHKPGQRRHTDRRESRRHHLLGFTLLDIDDSLRIDKQARLGRAPGDCLLHPHHAALGMDRQEKQVHQRCPLLRMDSCNDCHVDQQVSTDIPFRLNDTYECQETTLGNKQEKEGTNRLLKWTRTTAVVGRAVAVV